ncbi:hypothetical protein B6U81_03680 [Thermoplasmatales archaeon ex4484_30]|nr:MAG: hypothetical protein FE041_02725 [Thermoplasmata archaeon]OYT61158.1 MAG: hypothetical protein B6U81_03680 [Thermoplasmatales archaeon ex4484_30]
MKILPFLVTTMVALAISGYASTLKKEINIDIYVDNNVMIKARSMETITAKIEFYWSSFSIFPSKAEVHIEAVNVPEWLTVSISPSTFTLPVYGWIGNDTESVQINIKTSDVVQAFIPHSFKLHVYIPSSIGIKETHVYKEINVTMDFLDNGIGLTIPNVDFKNLKIKVGETERIDMIITNYCNGDVKVKLEVINISDEWEIDFEPKDFVIPSLFSGNNQKTVKIVISPEEAGRGEALIIANYSYVNSMNSSYSSPISISMQAIKEKTNINMIILISIITTSIVIAVAIYLKKRGKKQGK